MLCSSAFRTRGQNEPLTFMNYPDSVSYQTQSEFHHTQLKGNCARSILRTSQHFLLQHLQEPLHPPSPRP